MTSSNAPKSAVTDVQPSAGFTPGPWRVIDPDKNGQPVVSAADHEVATCWHHCVGSIEKEAHANALLIAAAPDLYEALRGLMAASSEEEEFFAYRAARAALEKASLNVG